MTVGDELPELPGIDKVDGLRRMMNKPALFEKILRDFHSRLHDSPQVIRATLANGDYSTAERNAHSVKGLAGTIGAMGLQDAAKALEHELHDGHMPSEATFAQFEKELRIVINGFAAGFSIASAG